MTASSPPRLPLRPNRVAFCMRSKDRGFTLVELMVTLVIALIILAGLSLLFVSTIRTRTELEKTSRQIESGRYALQLIGQDLALAGYVGNTNLRAFTGQAPVACASTLSDLGYEPTTSKTPFPVYAPNTTPACLEEAKTGSAVLVVSRVSTLENTATTAKAGEAYLQVSNCAAESLPFVIAAAEDEKNADTFSFMQKDCSSLNPSPLRRVIHRVYYVSTCNECGKDTVPTLKVVEYAAGATETVTPLVDGIEDLRFDYGIDMDKNGSPDCYVSDPSTPPAAEIDTAVCAQTTPAYDWTNSAENWSNVVTLRAHVLARATEQSAGWKDDRKYAMGLQAGTIGPFNDKFKRHVYSSAMSLRNVIGVRE